MNYKQQLAVIEGLSLPSDTQTRMDCPFCSGKNTLSVDTTENKISWYCFDEAIPIIFRICLKHKTVRDN